MQKTRPYRSYSSPVILRTIRVKCEKCNNYISGNEKCPCVDDIHPVQANSTQSLQQLGKIMSQPKLIVETLSNKK